MKLFLNPKKRGTTLIEILTYFTIFSVVMLAMMYFAIQIINANRISSNLNELSSNLEFISKRITSTIKMSSSVNTAGSTFNNNNGALALNMDNAAISPTRFYLLNNDIFLTEGIGSPIQLNSSFVEFSQLRFERVTSPQAPDQIILDLTATTPHGGTQLEKTLSIHSAISLRR